MRVRMFTLRAFQRVIDSVMEILSFAKINPVPGP